MAEIEVVEEIGAPADAAWEKLGDFAGIGDWMPGVESCEVEGEGVGAVRAIGFGGASVKERLESRDEAERTLCYSIVEGPVPVQNYLATIRVSETGAGACRVDWTARFDTPDGVPAEAIAPALEKAYGGSLKALKKLLEGG